MPAQKLITVMGATGVQGGSTIDRLLQHSRKDYAIRAITRDLSSDAARGLAERGIQVVQADLNDAASLITAFQGSYAIFAVTSFWSLFAKADRDDAAAEETQQGINLANAAAAIDTLEHYIWSTLPDASQVSGGVSVPPHYESKAVVTRYIQSKPSLLAKTTFLFCGYYASNFATPCLKPIYVPSANQYVQMQGVPADTSMASIGDTRANLGAFVDAILAQPEKTRGGRAVYAYVEMTTLGGLLQTWARAHRTRAQYLQVDKHAYYALWPKFAEEMDMGMEFWNNTKTRKWITQDGFLTHEDLGVDISSLLSVEEAMAALPPL